MIQILQLQKANLSELARFIVYENISHHNALFNEEKIVREINRVYTEDLSLFDSSVFYVVKNQMNTIVGSVKITTWNNKVILPIEKLYSINLDSLLCNDKKKRFATLADSPFHKPQVIMVICFLKN